VLQNLADHGARNKAIGQVRRTLDIDEILSRDAMVSVSQDVLGYRHQCQ